MKRLFIPHTKINNIGVLKFYLYVNPCTYMILSQLKKISEMASDVTNRSLAYS